MKQKRFTKLMSILLVMAMLFTMMPGMAWADETVLPVNGGTIDLVDIQAGPYTIQKLDVYTQGDYAPVSITSATQNGNTINVVLSESTSPTAALQAGLGGSGQASLLHSGNKCTLVNGSGTMNYSYTVRMGPQSVAGGSYTIHFTVPMGASYDVSLPEGEGFTVSGNETAFEGSSYTFRVSVAEGYDGSDMIVKVNGSELEGNNGTYTVEDVNSDLDITVEGIVKKEICNITAPSGEGFTFTGAATVYKGEGYSFKIAVDNAYNGTAMVVKANDEVLEGTDGSYTIAAVNEDIVITVDGIVKKEICNITAPEGEGFTFIGAATVYKGEDYSFKITVDNAYNGTAMVVKANDEVLEGTDGSYTIAAVNEDIVITVDGIVKKEICNITAPEGEGFTFTGAATVYKGEGYSFKIAVDNAYNGTAMVVKANGAVVEGTNGSYTIATVNENTEITVEGIVKKEIYTITAPEAGKFTFSGAETVYAGEDYTFTLKANTGYTVTVKVNGAELTGTNGSYTVEDVSENLIITVEVEMAPLPDKELPVADNVIDITDRNIYYFASSIYAKATNVKIEGVTVKNAYEDGTSIYIVLPYNTVDDANVSVTFGTQASRCTVSGTNGSLMLEDGDGSLTMTVTGKYSGSMKGSVAYTLIFIRELPAEEIPVCVQKTDTAEVWKDRALEINLDKYFTGAENYYLVEGENKTPIDAVYSFTPNQAGEHVLTFTASNLIGDCQDQLTITVKVKEIENGVYIDHATSNGSLDYVTFTDGEGNPIEGLNAVYANKIITVSLPKTYPLDGKVTATFVRKANSSGLPFLSASNAFNQGTGSRTDVFTNTLNNGAAARTAYLYNSEPKATSNSPETFTINYAIVNELPVLAEGQAAAAEATVTAGQPFTFKLGEIFADADGDDMTYLVGVNGSAAAAAEVDEEGYYSFVTNEAGVYTLVFTANDGKGTSTATYTVNLTVENSSETKKMTVSVPDNLEPKFYVSSGFGTDGKDILGEEITAVKGADGVYTLDYPKNASIISVRTDNYGGMAFMAEEGTSVVLRCVNMSVVDYDDNAAGSTNTVTYDGHTALPGTDGWLLVVGGSYTYTAVPENSDLAKKEKTETLVGGTGLYTVNLMLGLTNPITITAPTESVVKLYNYDTNKYYYATELDAKIIEANGDGTTTYYFVEPPKPSGPAGNCLIYHVTMPGKITKAGYLGSKKNINVVYSDTDKDASYRLDDYSQTGEANSAFTEDSVLLNINGQNNLSMSVGQTKTLKAYRAWEIITVSYQNYIITPNFHYEILEGKDIISLTEKDSHSAGEGDWKTLTALKEGTAVIEVTYDAMKVTGGSYDGIYGASDPARTGLAVIQVGGHDSSVNFGIESKASIGSKGSSNISYNANNKKAWDAEFDTLYFTGESGELKLAPTANSEITEVAVSNDKGETWNKLTVKDGKYTANIVSGNNIIRVTTKAGTKYQVVRGDKVTVSAKEVTGKSNGNGTIEIGETVRVTIDGLHTPIPKMAGNYNPGFGNNDDGYSSQHLNYTCNGEAIYGGGSQYNFITDNNFIEVKVPANGKIELTDGYIGVGVIGLTQFTDGGESHRDIPDNGCSTRGSKTTFHTRSMLPEITIIAGDAADENTAPTVVPGAVTEASIEAGKHYAVNPESLFTDAEDELTYTVSVNGGEAKVVGADYKYYAESAGTYTLTFTATDNRENSEAAVHTITLTVTEKVEKPEVPTGPKFDLPESQIKGYATVSFEDFAERVEGEKGLKYPTPLGIIVPATSVPYAEGDTIADVTLRLLKAFGIGASYSGSTKSGFYLGAITNFEVDNTPYGSMGEFDAGSGSGWMITHNGTFIDQGASQFKVSSGDVIQWQYTCQLGKDIGDPFYDEKDETVENVTTTTGTSGTGTATTTPTEVTVSGNQATATVTKENITETLKQAVENKADEIILQVTADDTKGAAAVKVQLDTSVVKDIAEKTDAALTVKTEKGTVSLDQETVKTVVAEAAGSTVTLEIVEVKAPTAAHKAAAGENGHVIQLVIKSGDKIISTFNDGKATVTVEIPKKLEGKKVAAIHIGDDGKVEELKGETVTVNGKKHYRFETPHFSTFALIDLDEEKDELTADEVKEMLAKLTPIARSVKTPNKNIQVKVNLDEADKEIIAQIEEGGYTVKYNYYRSVQKSRGYKSKLLKAGQVYTNTKGGTGDMYFYKVRVQVYDAEGKLIARTALKQCKYAKRVWTK